jgi:hypothetical protein
VYKKRGCIPLELDKHGKLCYNHFQNRQFPYLSFNPRKIIERMPLARSFPPDVRNEVMLNGTLAVNLWIHSEEVTSTLSPGSLPDSRFPILSRTNLLPINTRRTVLSHCHVIVTLRGYDLVGRISHLSPQIIL